MRDQARMFPRLAPLAIAALLLASTGCSYLRYRYEDALEMVDVGVTYSSKPGISFHFTCPFSLVALVGANMEGKFAGLGGGQIGVTDHYLKALGFVVLGFEEIGWGEYDRSDPATFHRNYQGLLGIPLSLVNSRPAYMPSCTHEIHLGWAGLVLNVRYTEIADFLLGLACIDLTADDGKRLGRWPWQDEEQLQEWSRNPRFWLFHHEGEGPGRRPTE